MDLPRPARTTTVQTALASSDTGGLRGAIWPPTLAAITVFGLFAWQGNAGFNLGDEGYLWYGAKQVMQGAAPLRDFMSYEPGRYYWSATLMGLWGDDGIMSLRYAVAIFQAAALLVALALIAGTERRRSVLFLVPCALTVAIWMLPRHKLFDISISILLVAALAFLLQKPTLRRCFLTGLCVGLSADFGRNHGLYGAIASVGILLWLRLRHNGEPGLFKSGAYWIAGACAGFAPVLLMALLIPGFAGAFWDSIWFLFEVKATNIPLPVPWPWLVDFNSMPLDQAIRAVMIGVGFVGIVAFGILALAWVTWQRLNRRQVAPVLVATAFLALPYAHFAYSRADMNHLAQGIFPTLIGCLALLAVQPDRLKWPLLLTLSAATLWVTHAFHPGWQCRGASACVPVSISGDQLRVDPSTADNIAFLRRLAERYMGQEQTFFAAPFWPGAYALLDRRAPVWEIYPLFPRGPGFEQAEIRRIEAANPAFAVIVDAPLDGREELRFRNTHPVTWRYIETHFVRTDDSPSPAYLTYRSKAAN
jgi:hypothetical protein